MAHTQEQFGDRTMFIFQDKNLSYERMVEAVDLIVKPEEKTKEEITSWTIAYTFQKGDIKVYFEHFYDPDYHFSFELYPLEITHLEEDILKLKSIIDLLDHFLYS